MPTGFYIRDQKPILCVCGESNPKNFYSGYRAQCKKCTLEKRRWKLLQQIPLCTRCDESDPKKFYPYTPTICKKCHYRVTSARKNPERRHETYVRRKPKAYEEAARAWDKNRAAINARQQAKRKDVNRRAYDKLNCDARRIVGKSITHLTTEEMKTILMIRLLKVIKMGLLTQNDSKGKLQSFNIEPLTTLLSLYVFKVKSGLLGELYLQRHRTKRNPVGGRAVTV
jgi:hypothetical protein